MLLRWEHRGRGMRGLPPEAAAELLYATTELDRHALPNPRFA